MVFQLNQLLTVENQVTADDTAGWGFHTNKIAVTPSGAIFTITHRDGPNYTSHQYHLFKSTNSGQDWQLVRSGIAGREPATIFTIGEKCYVVCSPNGVITIWDTVSEAEKPLLVSDFQTTYWPYLSANGAEDGRIVVSQLQVVGGSNIPSRLVLAIYRPNIGWQTKVIDLPERYAYGHIRFTADGFLIVCTRDLLWSEAGYQKPTYNNGGQYVPISNNYVWDRIGMVKVNCMQQDCVATFNVIKSMSPMESGEYINLLATDALVDGNNLYVLWTSARALHIGEGGEYRNGTMTINLDTMAVSDALVATPFVNQGRLVKVGDEIKVISRNLGLAYSSDINASRLEQTEINVPSNATQQGFYAASRADRPMIETACVIESPNGTFWQYAQLKVTDSAPPPPTPDPTYQQGFDAGYEAGLTNGKNQGYSSGYEDGKRGGDQLGYDRGIIEGRQTGIDQTIERLKTKFAGWLNS